MMSGSQAGATMLRSLSSANERETTEDRHDSYSSRAGT
jgi:hypothetical protein